MCTMARTTTVIAVGRMRAYEVYSVGVLSRDWKAISVGGWARMLFQVYLCLFSPQILREFDSNI